MFIHMNHDNGTHNYEYVQGYEYGYLTMVYSLHKSRKPDDNLIHAHLFIEKRANICERQSFGILHVFIDCWKKMGEHWFVCYVALRPKSTAMVIAGRSVHLTTLFPG